MDYSRRRSNIALDTFSWLRIVRKTEEKEWNLAFYFPATLCLHSATYNDNYGETWKKIQPREEQLSTLTGKTYFYISSIPYAKPPVRDLQFQKWGFCIFFHLFIFLGFSSEAWNNKVALKRFVFVSHPSIQLESS